MSMRFTAVVVFVLVFGFMGLALTAIPQTQGNYSKCVEDVRGFNTNCVMFVKDSQGRSTSICERQSKAMMLQCESIRVNEECQKCFRNLETLVQQCAGFYQQDTSKAGDATACGGLKRNLAESCSMKCPVCEDKLCRNGGKCRDAQYIFSCRCPDHVKGVHCETSRCSKTCRNEGTCIGDDLCCCPYPYTGSFCERLRLGSRRNPARSAREILRAGDSVGSGMYWIRPQGEPLPALTYCDMAFDHGGWMLASYGYVEVDGDDHRNKLMVNLNHPHGYLWLPQQRASTHGVIALSMGATLLARSSSYMLMAAGNNPRTGGVDEYKYVYKIDLRNITHKITFDNHNIYHGASGLRNISPMHLQAFNVNGLKGDLKNYTRFALSEALGVTSRDSFPTGYGFYDRKENFEFFTNGPFFPSVHSGSGRADSFRYGKYRSFSPDVEKTCYRFNFKGWYAATSLNNYGQMSIWFK